MRNVAYWLLLVMTFMIPWANYLILPGVGTASRAVGILAGAFWVFTVVATGKIRKIGLFHVYLFLFFLWNGISILWSIDVDSTLIQIITFAQMAIFCLMLWDLCTTRPAIRAVLQAYVLGLAILIVSTVAEFIASIGTDFALYGRYSASGNNANTTGIYLAMGLPMAWYLAMSAGKGKIMLMLRLVNYVYIPVIMFTIILTATRFAVIMSLPAFLFGLGTLNKLKPISRILIFVFLTAAVVQLSSMIPQASLQRLGTMDDEFKKGDFNDRTELWERGIDIWHDHPILGVGSGGYNEAVAPIYGRPRSVHNSFIAILAELGIIGMGLFGLILVTAIFQAWRHPTILDAWFWLTVLITWGLGSLALTWTYSKPTWLLLSLLAASASLYRQSDMSSPYVEPSYGNTATIPVPLLSTTQAPRDGDQV